jgi:hypothetical protein
VRKRLPALLLGGHLLLALIPVAAQAAPAQPAGPDPATESAQVLHHDCSRDGCNDHRDGHYRCMYHCDDRYGHRYDGYHDRRYHDDHCWYHDRWGWHRCDRGYRW